MNLKFQEWPKIHRLYRPVLITEKLDGTNACIVVEPIEYDGSASSVFEDGKIVGGKMDLSTSDWPGVAYNGHVVYAQSRKKVIAPGKNTDNYGFARFVRENAEAIVRLLGEGRHYGEWYGGGIQTGYGMDKDDKRFALFNVKRWETEPKPPQVTTVPLVYDGPFTDTCVSEALSQLSSGSWARGSVKAKAEGVVVHWPQSNTSFKVLAEDDDVSKTDAAKRWVPQPTGRVSITVKPNPHEWIHHGPLPVAQYV